MYLNFQIHPTQQKPVEGPLFSLLKVYIVDGFAHQWLPNFRQPGIRWPKGALCRCRSVRWGYPGYKGIGSAVGDVGGWTSTWFYLSVSSTSCGSVNHFYVNIPVWVDSTGSVGNHKPEFDIHWKGLDDVGSLIHLPFSYRSAQWRPKSDGPHNGCEPCHLLGQCGQPPYLENDPKKWDVFLHVPSYLHIFTPI